MPDEQLVQVTELRKVFRVRDATGRRGAFAAVDGISFTVTENSSLAIVGESGSGKTTTARIIANLETATSGIVEVCGRDRTQRRVRKSERRRRGREVQMVFQDPYSSLDPSQRIGDSLAEVLNLHFRLTKTEMLQQVATLIDQVGLDDRHARSLPRALSGGERQRAAIARALAARPRIVVLDEAVVALDVSIQAQVLNLLADIRKETGTTYIVVSHDLAVVRQITNRAIVMREGRIVEHGETGAILDAPQSPYTKLLRDSVPRPGWKPQRRAAGLA